MMATCLSQKKVSLSRNLDAESVGYNLQMRNKLALQSFPLTVDQSSRNGPRINAPGFKLLLDA